MKRLIPIVILLAVLTQGCGNFVRYMRDQPQEQTVVENGGFKLRLSKLESAPGFMPQSRYLVETSVDDGPWVKAHSWGQDDPWPLSDIDFRAVTPSIGYFFRMTEYGVTLDAGKTWKILDVHRMTENDRAGWIKKGFDHGVPRVVVYEDGNGSIYAQAYRDKNGPRREMYTTVDFGQNWQLTESAKSPVQ